MLQKSDRGRKATAPGPGNTQNIRSTSENASLVDMVEGVLFDIDIKPVLGSVVRLGQKIETCRAVKVSLDGAPLEHQFRLIEMSIITSSITPGLCWCFKLLKRLNLGGAASSNHTKPV